MSTSSTTSELKSRELLLFDQPKHIGNLNSDEVNATNRTTGFSFRDQQQKQQQQQQQQQQGQRLCSYRSRFCTGQMPCTHCRAESRTFTETPSAVTTITAKPWRVAFLPEHHRPYHCQHEVLRFPRSVTQVTQNVPRRLSSGSACDTCRRRKTKCDGGQPCAYCSVNNISCTRRPVRKKSHHHLSSSLPTAVLMNWTTDVHQQSPPNRPYDPLTAAEPQQQLQQPYQVSQWSSIKNESPPPTPPPADQSALNLADACRSSEKMPSITDQLSCRTFSAVTMAAIKRTPAYPIYPLFPPTPSSSTAPIDI
ncbi:hypothetical protein BX666DRAFT_2031131 [Dichotomocladium elegans]|nr:hypothetical protein BX666DRAFT_2031131 [Dichotomocladium elegans]